MRRWSHDALKSRVVKKPVPPQHIPSKVGRDPKLVKVLEAVKQGDWDAAIKLAARVTAMGRHAEAICRGKEAIANPDFYRQMGKNPHKLREEAIAALKERLKPDSGP